MKIQFLGLGGQGEEGLGMAHLIVTPAFFVVVNKLVGADVVVMKVAVIVGAVAAEAVVVTGWC